MKKTVKSAPAIIARSKSFIETEVWRLRLKDMEGKKGASVKSLRVLLIAIKEFIADQCALRASALTFYSLLSIVPVIAMAFAIAKGFGIQNMLEKELLGQFAGQEEVLNKIIEYARTLLEQTKGGLLAGIGAATLLWSVLKVMTNIEKCFNVVWANTTPRALGKKFSDYLSIILVAPLLLIMSGSATVLIVSQVTTITEKVAVLGIISPIIMSFLKLLPYAVIWVLFTFVYVFMPNTRVSVKSGLIGAIIAGTAFKLLQWLYVYFQVGVSRYNAIYGSFAALPLFLIWLQLSWLIVLFGAELSFAHQNVDEYELEPDSRGISDSLRKVISLSIVHLLVKTFQKGDAPLDENRISKALDIPIRLTKEVLEALSESSLITRTIDEEGKTIAWQPARDINTITVASVIEALEKSGVNELPVEQTREFRLLSDTVTACYDAIRNASSNMALKDI
jgi:membrane protein